MQPSLAILGFARGRGFRVLCSQGSSAVGKRYPDAVMRRCDDDDWMFDTHKRLPGTYTWGRVEYRDSRGVPRIQTVLWVMMPYVVTSMGGKSIHCLPVYRGPKPGIGKPDLGLHNGKPRPSWHWNGDEDRPTLRPSVNCGDEWWHGYITDGRIIGLR